jgi:hypothetical protein
MSSSSDIEKLFGHFGGDAGAYQEIGRENEARSARTRWPLLVTLDLTQPEIPTIGPRRGAAAQTPADDASQQAGDRQDTPPKDAASVTRARAPLFTRPHRRDIPPVAAVVQPTVQPAGPRGAARFSVLETKDGDTAQAEPAAARIDAVAPVATPPQAGIPAMPPRTSIPAAPTSAPATTWARAPLPAATPAPAAKPASILGKLFAPEPEPAPLQAPAAAAGSAPLLSVFDRLRGGAAQPASASAAAPASAARPAAPAASNSWLVNGPRRS